MSTPLQLLVHFVQEYICEERRKRPALWRALMTLKRNPIRHYPGFEVAANQPEQSLVLDAFREHPNQHIIIHAVEEFLQIHVPHETTVFAHKPMRLHDCVVGAASR